MISLVANTILCWCLGIYFEIIIFFSIFRLHGGKCGFLPKIEIEDF